MTELTDFVRALATIERYRVSNVNVERDALKDAMEGNDDFYVALRDADRAIKAGLEKNKHRYSVEPHALAKTINNNDLKKYKNAYEDSKKALLELSKREFYLDQIPEECGAKGRYYSKGGKNKKSFSAFELFRNQIENVDLPEKIDELLGQIYKGRVSNPGSDKLVGVYTFITFDKHNSYFIDPLKYAKFTEKKERGKTDKKKEGPKIIDSLMKGYKPAIELLGALELIKLYDNHQDDVIFSFNKDNKDLILDTTVDEMIQYLMKKCKGLTEKQIERRELVELVLP